MKIEVHHKIHISLFKNLTFPIHTVQPLLQFAHGAAQIGHRLLQHFSANESRTMLLSRAKSFYYASSFRSNLLHFSLLVEFSLQPRQVVFTVVAVCAHVCEDLTLTQAEGERFAPRDFHGNRRFRFVRRGQTLI